MTTSNEWFVRTSNKIYGPFTAKQLKQLAADSKITPDTLVRRDSDGNWVPGERVKGLFGSINSPSSKTAEMSPQPTTPEERDVADWIGKPEPSERAIANDVQTPTQPPEPAAPTRQPSRPPVPEQPSDTILCPYCSESIKSTAKKCKHCGEYLDASIVPQRSGVPANSSNPGIVAVLNLVIPGSGYLYFGVMSRGVALLVTMPLVYLILWAFLHTNLPDIHVLETSGGFCSAIRSL